MHITIGADEVIMLQQISCPMRQQFLQPNHHLGSGQQVQSGGWEIHLNLCPLIVPNQLIVKNLKVKLRIQLKELVQSM